MAQNPLYSPPLEITAKTERLIGEVCELAAESESTNSLAMISCAEQTAGR